MSDFHSWLYAKEYLTDEDRLLLTRFGWNINENGAKSIYKKNIVLYKPNSYSVCIGLRAAKNEVKRLRRKLLATLKG